LAGSPICHRLREWYGVQAEALMDQEIHMSDTVRNWALEVASRQVEIYHDIIGGRPGCS